MLWTHAHRAGNCLVEASKDAGLLILGMHSETGHRHADRLGPVIHAALQHAQHPVAVAPSSGVS